MNRRKMLTRAVEDSLREDAPHKLDDEILRIEGMSGVKYKKFANRLLSNDVVKRYLEIGAWKGSTAISALRGNHKRVEYKLIDNFSEFGGTQEILVENWRRHIGGKPNLINADCFAFDPKDKGISEIDVYLYDGRHTENDQYMALKHYYPAMAKTFIFIVDDWAWDHVRAGTMRAIGELQTRIQAKWELFSSSDGSHDPHGWWNGCGIFVLKK
jgi:hypothetical protein